VPSTMVTKSIVPLSTFASSAAFSARANPNVPNTMTKSIQVSLIDFPPHQILHCYMTSGFKNLLIEHIAVSLAA
jgi:hypothetical protein